MDTRRWWLRISSIGVLVSGTWTSATAANGQDGAPWGMHMMWGSWGIGMMLMMFLFWAGVIAAIIFFIRWLVTAGYQGHQAIAGHDAENALDILQKAMRVARSAKKSFRPCARCSRSGTDALSRGECGMASHLCPARKGGRP